jgi:predicted ferric reductase
LLAWLESTSIAVWLGESPSVWAMPTVLTLHTMGMAVLVGASWVLDLRLLGLNKNVPLSNYRWVFRAVAIGLLVNLVTGVLLFMKNATSWGTAFPFLMKMLFVVASAATILPIRTYVLNSGAGRDDVTSNVRLLAIASIVAWSAAVTAGRLLAYLVA